MLRLRRGAALEKKVRLECCDALEAAGFVRFRKNNVDKPLNEDFSCWVGLNAAICENSVEINPFVGVHAFAIERMISSINKSSYDRRVATYSIAMGEIEEIKDVRSFVFDIDDDEPQLRTEAARLAHIYATAGIDFSMSAASYDKLLPLLMDRVPMLGGYPESVASCLYLMGRQSGAVSFVQSFKESEPDYFCDFADDFLAYIKR